MVQQIELPAFIREQMARPAEPTGLLKVKADLFPAVAEVGRGEPVKVTGLVTAFGLPLPLPLLVVCRVTKKGEPPKPVGWAVTAPFIAAFGFEVPTEGWDCGEYAFQVIALTPGPPGLSEARIMRVVEPRYGGELEVARVGASPVLLYSHLLPSDINADFRVKNSGLVSERYRVILRATGIGSSQVDLPEVPPGGYWPSAATTSRLTITAPTTLAESTTGVLELFSHPVTGGRAGTLYASVTEPIDLYAVAGGLEAVAWSKVD